MLELKGLTFYHTKQVTYIHSGVSKENSDLIDHCGVNESTSCITASNSLLHKWGKIKTHNNTVRPVASWLMCLIIHLWLWNDHCVRVNERHSWGVCHTPIIRATAWTLLHKQAACCSVTLAGRIVCQCCYFTAISHHIETTDRWSEWHRS